MKAVRPVIVSNGIPYLHMTSVGSHIIARKGEQNKNGKGGKRSRISNLRLALALLHPTYAIKPSIGVTQINLQIR